MKAADRNANGSTARCVFMISLLSLAVSQQGSPAVPHSEL